LRRQRKTLSKKQHSETDGKLVSNADSSKNKEAFEAIHYNKLHSFENKLGRKSAIYFK
jgi:hypothetical protein